MRWTALAAVIGLVFAVGCGSKARSEEPVKLVDQPRTIRLGLIGAPLVVDGDALVHVAYRRDRFLRGPTRSHFRHRADAGARARRAVVG